MVIADFDVNGYAAGLNVPLSWLQTSNKARRVVAIGLGGSTAVGDTKVALFYGDQKLGEFDNTSAVDHVIADQMRYISTNFVLAPKMPLRVEVITASGSVCYMTMILKNLPARRRRY